MSFFPSTLIPYTAFRMPGRDIQSQQPRKGPPYRQAELCRLVTFSALFSASRELQLRNHISQSSMYTNHWLKKTCKPPTGLHFKTPQDCSTVVDKLGNKRDTLKTKRKKKKITEANHKCAFLCHYFAFSGKTIDNVHETLPRWNTALPPESQAISHNIKDTHTVRFNFFPRHERRVPVKRLLSSPDSLSRHLSLIPHLQT